MIPDMLVMSTRTWNRLSPQDQQLVVDSADASTQRHEKASSEEVAKARAEARKEGVPFVTDVDREAFRQATASLNEQLGECGLVALGAVGYGHLPSRTGLSDPYTGHTTHDDESTAAGQEPRGGLMRGGFHSPRAPPPPAGRGRARRVRRGRHPRHGHPPRDLREDQRRLPRPRHRRPRRARGRPRGHRRSATSARCSSGCATDRGPDHGLHRSACEPVPPVGGNRDGGAGADPPADVGEGGHVGGDRQGGGDGAPSASRPERRPAIPRYSEER